MNAKTAKLIGKYTTWAFGSKRIAKRAWNRMPWTKRNTVRLRMQTQLMTADKSK